MINKSQFYRNQSLIKWRRSNKEDMLDLKKVSFQGTLAVFRYDYNTNNWINHSAWIYVNMFSINEGQMWMDDYNLLVLEDKF